MSEKDDLLTILRAALPELKQQWPIRTLAVFGSVARGDAKASSDLDLLVEFDRPVALSAFLMLETTLSELTGRRVDLVSRRALKPFIGAHVLREGRAGVTARRDYRDFLADIIGAVQSIIAFVEGMTLETYLDDEKTRYAVMRGYEIMGEAVRHLPNELKTANSDVPWVTMTAMRNRIVHGYFGIDDSILFTTIEAELKPLLPRLAALAREHGAAQ